MSAILTVRISKNEKAAIERAAVVSGRSQSSLAAAAIGRDMRELAWLEEKMANAKTCERFAHDTPYWAVIPAWG